MRCVASQILIPTVGQSGMHFIAQVGLILIPQHFMFTRIYSYVRRINQKLNGVSYRKYSYYADSFLSLSFYFFIAANINIELNKQLTYNVPCKYNMQVFWLHTYSSLLLFSEISKHVRGEKRVSSHTSPSIGISSTQRSIYSKIIPIWQQSR